MIQWKWGVFGNVDVDDDDCDDLDNDNNSRLFASSFSQARFIANQDAMVIKIWTMAIARSFCLLADVPCCFSQT